MPATKLHRRRLRWVAQEQPLTVGALAVAGLALLVCLRLAKTRRLSSPAPPVELSVDPAPEPEAEPQAPSAAPTA